MTQYVACRFKAHDKRTYTYHNDGEPVRVGDRVKVEDARGGGWKPVEVVSIGDEKPKFPTKPILGKVEGADVDKSILDKRAAADDLGGSFADMMLDADEDMQSLIDRDRE